MKQPKRPLFHILWGFCNDLQIAAEFFSPLKFGPISEEVKELRVQGCVHWHSSLCCKLLLCVLCDLRAPISSDVYNVEHSGIHQKNPHNVALNSNLRPLTKTGKHSTVYKYKWYTFWATWSRRVMVRVPKQWVDIVGQSTYIYMNPNRVLHRHFGYGSDVRVSVAGLQVEDGGSQFRHHV